MSLTEITTRFETAAQAHGRAPQDITLIAVSKVQTPERVEAVLEQGHRVYGENRVQEAQGRWPDFQARFNGIDLRFVPGKDFNNLDGLFQKVSNKMDFTNGIAYMFDSDGQRVTSIDQVEDGGNTSKPVVVDVVVDGVVVVVVVVVVVSPLRFPS